MKNKPKTYLLLVAALAVWGMIGYKIISALNPEIPEPLERNIVANFKPQPIKEQDTISIQTIDRDPFLGTITARTKTTTKAHTNTTSQAPWPEVFYGGMVKKQNTNTQIFVVNINTKQYMLKPGQTIDDVLLVKGNAKEIQLRYNKEQKTFTLQQ